ncbi:MAG TPA: TolC family protein [Bryobacteraceae bacterium]|nr:TolC family protein [Bryobacteraceae bacterium]
MSGRSAHPFLEAGRLVLAVLVAIVSSHSWLTAQPLGDYTVPAKVFPNVFRPYQSWNIPRPSLSGNGRLAVQDGKLRLSMEQLIEAVVDNNLAIASARYYLPMAQTDLLRARSGASPRGVDVSLIPSEVFAGAQGGSILGSAGSTTGNGFASNAGGITGTASQVLVRPSGVFDPTFSVALSLDRTESPLNTLVVAGVPSVTTHTAALSLNYIQDFTTGTSFTVSYAMQRLGSTQLHLLYDPAFTPGFTATLSQQLLNGFGPKVNRALINVATNEQKIEREAFRQQVITALSSAQNTYWDLVAAQQGVRAANDALAVAQQLAENNKKQVEVGTMANLDVVTAQAQVAASQRDLIVAQTNVQNAELQLKNMLSKKLEEPLASASIETTDSFPEPDDAQLPALAKAVEIANQNRPEVSVAEGNIKSQKDVLPFLRNALRPTVNAFALVNTVGLYNVFGTGFSEAVHFKYPQIAFGLLINFPVRNRQAQADEVRSRLELSQAQDTLVRTQSQIEVDVHNALITVTQTRAQVAAARETVRLEEQKLDAEQQKLTAGLSTSYNVVLIQRDLTAAQLAEVQARDTYAKARVSLDQAMGVTLDTSHVNLDAVLRGQSGTAQP